MERRAGVFVVVYLGFVFKNYRSISVTLPTTRDSAIAQAIAALERAISRCLGEGSSRGRMIVQEFRNSPEFKSLASLRSLAPAPADQSDAELNAVIEAAARAIYDVELASDNKRPVSDSDWLAVKHFRGVMEAGRASITAIDNARALTAAPADQSDAGRNAVIEAAKAACVYNVSVASLLAARERRQDYREFMSPENRKLDEAIQTMEDAKRPDTNKRRTFDPRDAGFSLADDADEIAEDVRALTAAPAETVGRGEEKVIMTEEQIAKIITEAFHDFQREGPAQAVDQTWSRKAARKILLANFDDVSPFPAADREADTGSAERGA